MMNTMKAGDSAPQFILKNQRGLDIDITSLQGGKVLVYFYPKASTPGCTVQAKGLRDSVKKLNAADVTVLGISPDPVARLAKFHEKESLNFDLLSDEDHVIADVFGVWGLKKFMGKEYDGIHRLSFLIDEVGTITHVFDKFKTKDHHEVVLAAL
jgi:peroxiredoxin Q/BCP